VQWRRVEKKQAKASSLDETSSHSADRAVAGEKQSTPPPVGNASKTEIQSAKAASQVWVIPVRASITRTGDGSER
jgi:hypothetical protein